MNISKFVKSAFIALVIAVVGIAGLETVSAAQIDYNNPNNQPIKNARFNAYTNVPAGVGNEADFVRLRKSTGDPTVAAVQNDFIDPVNASCKVGEKFDIRTYVHNSANAEFNNNGSGSAVAHNVTVAMQAPLNTNGKQFKFTSSINASNASSVTDKGTLNCSDEVRLKLVPKSVHVYSKSYGWKGAGDSAVNGSLKIGSRSVGSGDVWGCWEDRVVVVYVVEVVKVPKVPSTAKCEALAVTVFENRRIKARVVSTAQNATVTGYRIDWGDGSSSNQQEDEHTYAKAGDYKVVGSVQVRFADGSTKWLTGESCEKSLTFKEEIDNCPIPGKEHLPADSDKCKEPVPQVLPATGPADIAGIFAATTLAGAIAYNVVYRRFNS